MENIANTLDILDIEILEAISEIEPCLISELKSNLVRALKKRGIGSDLKIRGEINIQFNFTFSKHPKATLIFLERIYPDKLFEIGIVNKCIIINNNVLVNLRLLKRD